MACPCPRVVAGAGVTANTWTTRVPASAPMAAPVSGLVDLIHATCNVFGGGSAQHIHRCGRASVVGEE